MKTITHCLLLLLLFVYTTESVNPFSSIFQRRALYSRITKAVQQKDPEHNFSFPVTTKFISCLYKPNTIPSEILSIARRRISIQLTSNYEFVLLNDYTKEQRDIINKRFKFCGALYPKKVITRADSVNEFCYSRIGVTTCLKDYITQRDYFSLMSAYNSSIAVTKERSSETEIITDDSQWKKEAGTILSSEISDIIDCFIVNYCTSYFASYFE